MNSQEAKFILQAYRHNGEDAADPQFQEALQQAQNDPELAQWFAQEIAFNAAVSKKIKDVPVPADLKSNILAGRKIIRPGAPWYRRTWLAAAACFFILAGITSLLLFSHRGNKFALFRNDMTDFLSNRFDRLDMHSSDLSQIREFLDQHGGAEDLNVPEKVAALRSLGCRILDWHGGKVTLICFKVHGTQEVHLLVADRSKFRDPPPARPPQFDQAGKWTTASWTRGNKVYLLAGRGERSMLENFF